MVSCLTAVHIWTLKDLTIIPDSETGVFTYHEKNSEGSSEQHYFKEKAYYTESRDVSWTPRNKRPDKLKDALKEAEELMSQSRCLRCQWIEREKVLLVLATGALIWLRVNGHTGDVDRIRIDKTLIGKLTADNPSDVLYTETYMVFCYPDTSKIDFVFFMKKNESSKKHDKLSSYDPKISEVELVGPVNRKLERKLGHSPNEDIVMVWWPTAGYEAWPWSPMTSEKERANLVLYTVVGPKLELVAYTRTDCDPIGIQYSSLNQDQLFSVEHSQSSSGELQAHISIYECSRNRVNKQWTSRVPVQSEVTCFGRNPTEDKLMLGCHDGTILLYDHYLKRTHGTRVNFKPHIISWHPSGVLAFISSSKGDIQIFDMALSAMNIQLVNEEETSSTVLDLSRFFRSQPVLVHLAWNPCLDRDLYILPECRDSLAIFCDRGPMVMLQLYHGVLTQGQLSPLSLVKQYVKFRRIDEAIKIVASLNWNLEGQTCYASVNIILNHLLRNSLNLTSEEQLETTLGLFYAPAKPLSELTVLEYRDPMSRLARRFFHHLLRYARFEKAFLLAVDIGAKDLFMDIHYLATDKGELALAEVARRKAFEVEGPGLGGDSGDLYDEEDNEQANDAVLDRLENGDSDDSLSGSDEYYKEINEEINPHLTSHNQSRDGTAQHQMYRSAPPPPPMEFANPAVDPRFQSALVQPVPAMQNYVDAAELLLEEREALLADSAPVEYRAALLDDDEGPILPPPPSHADDASLPSGGDRSQSTQGTTKSSSISVIHFGIV